MKNKYMSLYIFSYEYISISYEYMTISFQNIFIFTDRFAIHLKLTHNVIKQLYFNFLKQSIIQGEFTILTTYCNKID